MDEVWRHASTSDSVRRIDDIRLALTLRHDNVSDFATANGKHFRGFGFSRVWNPMKPSSWTSGRHWYQRWAVHGGVYGDMDMADRPSGTWPEHGRN